MTSRRDIMNDMISIPTVSIGLPDMNYAMAIFEGNVILSSTLTLTHMLYVPNLTCNLLFGS